LIQRVAAEHAAGLDIIEAVKLIQDKIFERLVFLIHRNFQLTECPLDARPDRSLLGESDYDPFVPE
jgi:hypothetical protein